MLTQRDKLHMSLEEAGPKSIQAQLLVLNNEWRKLVVQAVSEMVKRYQDLKASRFIRSDSFPFALKNSRGTGQAQ